MKAYRADIGVAKDALFDRIYGADSHIYLGLLATHPSYQGRGAGRALVQWGLDKAKIMGWTVTLFSSPMGESFMDCSLFRCVMMEVGRRRHCREARESCLSLFFFVSCSIHFWSL